MILIQGDYSKSKKYADDLMQSEYFEFHFPYVEEQVTFREINRFNDESRRLTRFKNKYTGKVVINITEWADKPLNSYFRAFSYFIMDRILEYGEDSVALICETTCVPEFIENLETQYDCRIRLVDVGVKNRENTTRVIGFIPYADNYRKDRAKEA